MYCNKFRFYFKKYLFILKTFIITITITNIRVKNKKFNIFNYKT